MQAFAGNLGKVLPLHRKRGLVQVFDIKVLEHAGIWHIAEQGDLVLETLVKGMLAPADDNIWPDAHSL